MRDPVESLLEQTARLVEARRRLPESTYRLQFWAGFTFQDAKRIAPYLAELGITHCYASPYLKARPGSRHGYDIVDHRRLNPEIGSEEDYAEWVAELQRLGLAQVLDVVPNHMGIVGNENEWWNDVLENGLSSPFAGYFDIDWNAPTRPELQGRVLLPILGNPYGEALESQQLKLEFAGGAFFVRYFDHRFPIAPRTYALILGHRIEELQKRLPADDPALLEYQSILTAVRHLPPRTETDPALLAERSREKEVIKRRLTALVQDCVAVRQFLDETIAEFNGKPGEPRSFDLLDALLDKQAYRLSFWRVASDEINYRRFFDVNELAALSAEREEVFLATHELVLKLLASGAVSGVRIDHIDGLYHPRQYLERLQQHYVLACAKHVFDAEPAFRSLDWDALQGPLREQIADGIRDHKAHPALYAIVEKILGPNEALPHDWPVYGASGYDFLNLLNGLFVAETARDFTRLYFDRIGDDTPFSEVAYRSKRLVLQSAMSGELHMLAHQFDRLAQRNRWSRDLTRNSLRLAVREVIACFPVYRSYIADEGVHDTDRAYLQRAIRLARNRNPAVSGALFHFVRDTLLLKPPTDAADEAYRAEQRHIAGKFQQVTSPVMAKGIEDTAFYQFNRLLSLNEVGGDPDRFGVPPPALHRALEQRQAKWPRAFSATATHDTKRGEDVRARLNVLSEIPAEWRDAVARWAALNAPYRITLDEQTVPDANEEYLLYQTLVGTLEVGSREYAVGSNGHAGATPVPEVTPYSAQATAYCLLPTAAYVKRIQDYMHKALHEAKVHSSWINPDPAYDDAVRQFTAAILDTEKNRPFLDDLHAFAGRVAHYGYFNSLAQALIKFTAPGVPDTYQGTELWDFSLVDPDNRRPVDFDLRARLLADLQARSESGDVRRLARELVESKEDGRVKLYLTWRALNLRREQPGLFAEGDYVPLEVDGARREHLFAFLRRRAKAWALVAVPRLLTAVIADDQAPLGGVWGDAAVRLPAEAPRQWRNVLTAERVVVSPGEALPAAELLAAFPVALLTAEA